MRRLQKLFVSSLVIIVAILMLALIFSQKLQQNKTVTTKNASSIYYGVYIHENPAILSGVTAFEQDTGKNVSLIQTFEGWGMHSNWFNTLFANAVRTNGSIPFITWTSTKTDATPLQPDYSLKSIIDGNFDRYIASYAAQAKSWGHPFFLRFDQEMNDNWAPWDEFSKWE